MMRQLSAYTQSGHRARGGVKRPRVRAPVREDTPMFVGRSRLTFCLVLVASLLLSPVVSAQSTTAGVNDWSALRAVEVGSKLSVKLKTGKTVEGRLTGVTDDALS